MSPENPMSPSDVLLYFVVLLPWVQELYWRCIARAEYPTGVCLEIGQLWLQCIAQQSPGLVLVAGICLFFLTLF